MFEVLAMCFNVWPKLSQPLGKWFDYKVINSERNEVSVINLLNIDFLFILSRPHKGPPERPTLQHVEWHNNGLTFQWAQSSSLLMFA